MSLARKQNDKKRKHHEVIKISAYWAAIFAFLQSFVSSVCRGNQINCSLWYVKKRVKSKQFACLNRDIKLINSTTAKE